MEYSIKAVVRDPSLQQHLLQQLRSPSTHLVPSPSMVIVHRLTLTLGFYAWQAELMEALLLRPGGTVSWRTVDSSPKGGYDWVLHGHRTIALADIADALESAHVLCASEAPEATQREHARKLEQWLQLTQGAPVGVGSGEGSARRKIHAVVHSQRLQSQSWPSAVALMNRTCTWTGDCGTEANFWRFRSSLKELFGTWVLPAADHVPEDVEFVFNEDGLAAEASFDFEPEAEPEAGSPVFD